MMLLNLLSHDPELSLRDAFTHDHEKRGAREIYAFACTSTSKYNICENLQYAICNMQYAICNMQYEIWTMDYGIPNNAIPNIQYAIPNMQYAI